MSRYNSILISPGRFPGIDSAILRPGHPKPRILMPRGLDGSAARREVRR